MDEHGDGNSVAAWTGTILLVLGSALIAVGVFFGWGWATWSGVAIAVIGVGAWWGLNAAGYDEAHWNQRDA